jgi:hypothetical protein
MGEKRPVDHIDEVIGITAEAAELAEYIRDTDPRWKREELLTQLVDIIDDAHQEAAEAHVELDE